MHTYQEIQNFIQQICIVSLEEVFLIVYVHCDKDVPRILVGHKYNEYGEYTEDFRVIKQQVGEALANEYEASFIEVDSMTGENVEEVRNRHAMPETIYSTCSLVLYMLVG